MGQNENIIGLAHDETSKAVVHMSGSAAHSTVSHTKRNLINF